MIVTKSAEIGSAATTTAQTATAKKSMGKDDFMKLLVAQLEHQNPLEPMQGTEFTGQLAQFSTVEQIFKMNETLQGIKDSNSQLNSSLALNMIGKQVEADGNQVSLGRAGSSTLTFNLADKAANADILVYNSAGDFITKITQENLSAGRHEVVWNGKDSQGVRVADGNYNFRVTATDADGKDVQAATYTRGTIDGISYEGKQVYATIGNRRIPVESITEIKQ